MLDQIILLLVKYTYIPVAGLFTIKVVSFLRFKSKRQSIAHFFYFSSASMMSNFSRSRVKFKRDQNRLSIAILALTVLQLVLVATIFGQ